MMVNKAKKAVNHSGEIVKLAIKERGMTQIELAKRVGRDQTLISRYISGQIEISDGTARAIAEVLGIDFEELRRQLQRDRLERRKDHLVAEFREVIPEGDKIEVANPEEMMHVGRVGVEDIVSIPFLDSVPKSLKFSLKEKSDSYVLPTGVHVDPDKSFALKARGENITDDEVDEGDIIVVDASGEISDGDRVLIIINGKPALRKIYRAGGAIVLQSSRRDDPPMVLTEKDDYQILGRLILCTKSFVAS